MDGHESADVVPAALEPAAAVSGGLPAMGPVPGLIGALGNHTVASMEASGEQRPEFTPSPPADLDLGRALADTLQQRPVGVARIPASRCRRSRREPGANRTPRPRARRPVRAHHRAHPEPAPTQGRAGGIAGGMMEMVKQMMEEQAKARADLEAEITELEASVAISARR